MDSIERTKKGLLTLYDCVFYAVSPGGMEEEFFFTFSKEEEIALLKQLAMDYPGQKLEEAIKPFDGNSFSDYLREHKLSYSGLPPRE